MKTIGKFMIFLVVPLMLLTVVALLRQSWGSYYFSNNADPAYLYLINSLNVATLHPVQHVDNPGTTVQMLGGLVIRAIALLQNIKDVEADVFNRPEYYLIAINRFLFSINLLGVAALGFVAYRLTKSIWSSFLVQAAPFGSYLMLKSMLTVSPETMSVFISILLILLILWAANKNGHEEKPGIFTLLSAVVLALGLATKLTFIPFVLIPLIILKNIKWRVIFILLVVAIFHVLLIPAYAHYDFLLYWIKILILHTENYGQGLPEVVNIASAALNLLKLVALEHTFFIILFLSIAQLACIYFNKKLNDKLHDDRFVRILMAVTIAVVFQTLLVAKQYSPRYMIPSFMLLTTMIYLNAMIYAKIRELNYFEFLGSLSFRIGLLLSLAFLFFVRHFIGYMPGDTAFMFKQTITSRTTLTDWIPQIAVENYLFVVFLGLLLFSGILIIYRKMIGEGKALTLLGFCLASMVVLYHFRHVDFGGFNYRCSNEKREALAIIDVVENKYKDYVKIFGWRASSKLYALRYGTSTNFTRTDQLYTLNKLYEHEDVYFWRLRFGERVFQNWTGKVALTDILKRSDDIIFQGDRSLLNQANADEIETNYNIQLEPVYIGATEIIYRIHNL